MKILLAQLNPIIGDLEGNAEKIFEVCKNLQKLASIDMDICQPKDSEKGSMHHLYLQFYRNFKPKTPSTINIIEIIFVEVILSFKKKYPINIEKNILDSLRAPTIGIGA